MGRQNQAPQQVTEGHSSSGQLFSIPAEMPEAILGLWEGLDMGPPPDELGEGAGPGVATVADFEFPAATGGTGGGCSRQLNVLSFPAKSIMARACRFGSSSALLGQAFRTASFQLMQGRATRCKMPLKVGTNLVFRDVIIHINFSRIEDGQLRCWFTADCTGSCGSARSTSTIYSLTTANKDRHSFTFCACTRESRLT